MTPLLDALNVPAITAHERQDATALPGLRRLGAALALHGIAENGGLVGGAVENLFFGDRLHEVHAAAEGFRWLGLSDVADLVERARDEYRRFRPTGWEELSAEDERLWGELDAEFSALAPDDRLEAAIAARLPQIAPGHG